MKSHISKERKQVVYDWTKYRKNPTEKYGFWSNWWLTHEQASIILIKTEILPVILDSRTRNKREQKETNESEVMKERERWNWKETWEEDLKDPN